MTEQKLIIDALGVAPSFDVTLEAHRQAHRLSWQLRRCSELSINPHCPAKGCRK